MNCIIFPSLYYPPTSKYCVSIERYRELSFLATKELHNSLFSKLRVKCVNKISLHFCFNGKKIVTSFGRQDNMVYSGMTCLLYIILWGNGFLDWLMAKVWQLLSLTPWFVAVVTNSPKLASLGICGRVIIKHQTMFTVLFYLLLKQDIYEYCNI